jgi:TrpR-related protein YerC/YecD
MRKKPELEMAKPESYKPHTAEEKALISAFTMLSSEQEVANFLRDLLTPAELEEFSNRLEIARLLVEREKSYLEIAQQVGTSTTTVTRVAQWLFRGCGGYQHVLKMMKDQG